jgi:hypothetical protein
VPGGGLRLAGPHVAAMAALCNKTTRLNATVRGVETPNWTHNATHTLTYPTAASL